ncbi:serine/threonine-protein kinase [Thermogemmatispora sp.]|uniref:serine/threonine-protein kinase n=1 Tax=Thermogemmatispora sp. TaxID=1968838 RepID=UPI001D8E4B04|nr:serine/threonine-protein kinase [Thermogemmatispora sp.]MBX5451497.1 serine/threonine protein kinase [Thermogemmatispora sp.]
MMRVKESDDESELEPGTRLGNYSLIRLLGKGGMARVYLARQIYIDRLVAIKVLNLRASAWEAEELRREASLLARLAKHPHIVQIYEFDFAGCVPFLVMEYAPYGSMRSYCGGGACLWPREACGYLRQAAAALQTVHNYGLVHQDVKPDNLLLARPGHLLLSDFGLATSPRLARLRATHMLVGTAAYMAPEQFEGRPSMASDQYALAVVLYEWLCGAPPFVGSLVQLQQLHRCRAPLPSLRERRPSLPPAIEPVLARALAHEPEQRYPSVWAFARACERALLGD